MPDNANSLTRSMLKTSFLAGKKPTAADFANVFDATLNKADDHIGASSLDGLSVAISLGNNDKDTVSIPGNLSIGGALQLAVGPSVSGVVNQDINLANHPEKLLVTANAVSQFVSNAALGLTLRAQARAVLTNPASLSGVPPAVDGVALRAGDKVLATRQGGSSGVDSHPDNVLWVVQTGAWTRAPELDGNPYYELERGTAVMATDGGVYGGTLWVMDGDPAKPSWTYRTDLDYLRAGNGLAKQGLNLNLKLAPNSGLQADSTGLAVDPGNGITINSNGVSVVAGNGLDASGGAVNVKLAANSGLSVDASGLKVAPGAGLAADGAGVKVVAGNGLDASGSAVNVKLAANSGLSVDAAGLKVAPGAGLAADGSGVKVVAGNGLDASGSAVNVKLAANSGLSVDPSGLRVAPGAGLAADGSGVKVVAGNGLDASGSAVNVKLAANSGLSVDAAGLKVNAMSPLAFSAGALGLNYAQLDANYLSQRIVFVAEAATPDLTLQAVQAALNAGAILVATYKAA